MATRIHNFSYSGSTGLLQFVPCVGDEKACKVYIKSIRATQASSVGGGSPSLRLLTKSSDNLKELTRAFFYGWSGDIELAGGCTSISSITTVKYPPPFVIYSGVGCIVGDSNNLNSFDNKTWNVPEYFYMKPGDTLTLNGYVGTFHIELMAISES